MGVVHPLVAQRHNFSLNHFRREWVTRQTRRFQLISVPVQSSSKLWCKKIPVQNDEEKHQSNRRDTLRLCSTLMLRNISLVSEGDSVSASPPRTASCPMGSRLNGGGSARTPLPPPLIDAPRAPFTFLCQSTSLLINPPTESRERRGGRSKRLEDRDMELKEGGRRDKSKNKGKFV